MWCLHITDRVPFRTSSFQMFRRSSSTDHMGANNHISHVSMELPHNRCLCSRRQHHDDANITKICRMPLPQSICITDRGGNRVRITTPSILGSGSSRDVLSGIDPVTREPSSLCVKIQEFARWHEHSNLQEFKLATSVLQPFMPEILGWARCTYDTRWKIYDLSVLVVHRVTATMDQYFNRLFSTQADHTALRIVFAWLDAVFHMIHDVCLIREVKLTDLHTRSIGIYQNSTVVLLDTESATVEKAWGSKKRANNGVKTFFAALFQHCGNSGAHPTWTPVIQELHRCLYDLWWRDIQEIPARTVIQSHLGDALLKTYMVMKMQKHDARITTSSDDSTIPSHTQVQAGQRRRQQDADMSSRKKQRRHETEQTAPNSHSLPSSAQPRTDELFPAGAAGQYAEPVGALAVATAPTPKSHLDAASPPQPGRFILQQLPVRRDAGTAPDDSETSTHTSCAPVFDTVSAEKPMQGRSAAHRQEIYSSSKPPAPGRQ